METQTRLDEDKSPSGQLSSVFLECSLIHRELCTSYVYSGLWTTSHSGKCVESSPHTETSRTGKGKTAQDSKLYK